MYMKDIIIKKLSIIIPYRNGEKYIIKKDVLICFDRNL